LEGEAVDVAVDRVPGVVGHGVGEAGFVEAAERGVDVAEHVWADVHAGDDEQTGPGVAEEDVMGGDGAFAHGGAPIGADCGGFDFADDEVGDAVEDFVFVCDVVVEGHGFDAELLGELAHGEGVEALGVGEVEGGAEDAVSGEGGAARGGRRVALLGHRSRFSLTDLHRKLNLRRKSSVGGE